MRAARYERTGPAHEVLEIVDLPLPEPGAREVRVRLAWSGVNPSDVKSRSGIFGRAMPFPAVVPHSDGAGIVDAVGAGVSPSRIGERVWVWNAAWGRANGTAAEYVVLPAGQAVPLPPQVDDLAVGACLGIPALTAYHALATDGGVTGKRVLVAGGAGAVGHYAVQLARRLGAAQVVATVSGPAKGALATAAGADVVVNYREPDARERILDATGGQGVDRIVEVDIAANVALDVDVVTPDGDIVVYGSSRPEVALPFGVVLRRNVGLRFFIVYNLRAADRARAVAHLTAMLARGELAHNIAERVPLARIADAHAMVEDGKVVGNVVVACEA